MTRLYDEPIDVEAEAAAWDVRLRRPGVSPSDREAFQQWLGAEPEHQAAWARLETGLSALRAGADAPELRAFRDEARAGARQARMRRWATRAGIAAAVLVTLGLGFAGMRAGPMLDGELAVAAQGGRLYRTSLNERTKVTLADGSRLTLDSDTRLAVRFRSGRRDVTLLSGRALFEVAKDPGRQFVVRAGDRSVTALGTVFDVRLGGKGRVRVTLVEGRVAVAPLRRTPGVTVQVLAPRQQFVEGEAVGGQVRSVDPDKVLTWTEGDLLFEDERLASAVEEMNRYARAKIVIADPALADLRINGLFRTGNQTGFVGALQATLPVDAHQDEQGRIVVSPRATR